MEAIWEEVGKAWEIFLQSASDCLAGMFSSHICYLVRSGKFSISFSVLFLAFWTWNALLVLLVGSTFKMQVLGNWRGGETLPFLLKRKRFNLLRVNMKSQARLPVGSAGEDRGQHKVWDPLWGTCQSPLWVLGESQPALAGSLLGGVLLSWERKYPSSAINVQTAEHHLKERPQCQERRRNEPWASNVFPHFDLFVTLLVALAWFLHTCVW